MAKVADATPGKVLVIGAGVTGLMAGHLLKQKGVEFQIIEASSRWGGRIKDAESGFADFPVALGAEWVHATQIFSAADIYGPFACCFGDMVLHTASCPALEDVTDGTCKEHAIFPDNVDDLNSLQNGKVEKASKTDSHFFNIPGDNKFHTSSWVTVFEQRILPSVEGCIVYNSPVTEIKYQADKVTVKTASATYEADKVLVCVPVSILKKGGITFNPPLPEAKAAALKSVKADPGLKVFMEFKEKFYPHFVLMQNIESSGFYMYMDETVGKTTEKHILGLVVVGDTPYKKMTSKGSDAESIKGVVLRELDELFDGKATPAFVNCVVQNWETEPFIECGVPDPESADSTALAAPVDGKVFFAGDAMNPDPHNNCYVQGACETAYIAMGAMSV